MIKESTGLGWPDSGSPPKHEVVTICGSMRNFERMLDAAGALTDEGAVVLAPFVAVAPHEGDSDRKAKLDELHVHKIDLCSRVVVVTGLDGYFGESTRREIEYARATGKTVEFRRLP